jgi:hypothetical protein
MRGGSGFLTLPDRNIWALESRRGKPSRKDI